jgi:hypothetical protein
MIRPRSIAALLCAAALSACSKDSVQNISAPATGADIKFFNFGVNAPGVNFYANDTLKLTATSIATCTPSTDPKCATTGIESTTGTVYAGAGNAGLYSQIAPGQYTFTGKIAAATDKGVSIASLPMTLADGKSYSFYVSGFYNTATKTAESFVVEDPFASKIDFTVAYVRFVNASSNSSPMTLYVTNPATGVEVPVGAAVSYKAAGAFTALPVAVYDLRTRVTGSATNVITRTTVSFVAGKVYTVSAGGDITSTTTTKPFLDVTANR